MEPEKKLPEFYYNFVFSWCILLHFTILVEKETLRFNVAEVAEEYRKIKLSK